MALTSDQLHGAAALLLATARGANPLAALRASLPGVAVTRCEADDMRGEAPWLRSGGYDLFLVDTASHCWRIVADPASASGIVLAPAAPGARHG